MFNRPQNPDMEELGFDPLMRRGPALEDTPGQITQTQSAFRDKSIPAVKIDGTLGGGMEIEVDSVPLTQEPILNLIPGEGIQIEGEDEPSQSRLNVTISSRFSDPLSIFSTDFAQDSFQVTDFSDGRAETSNEGMNVVLDNALGNYVDASFGVGLWDPFDREAVLRVSINGNATNGSDDVIVFCGVSDINNSFGPYDFDLAVHFGFKLTSSGGGAQWDVRGTQSDGSSESTTDILVSLIPESSCELKAVYEPTVGITYYARVIGGDTQSAFQSSNLPTVGTYSEGAGTVNMQSVAAANTSNMQVRCFSFIRP